MVRPCFSSGTLDDGENDYRIHLYVSGETTTLCGLPVLGGGLDGRRAITCPTCKQRKPRILGGT